MSSTRNTAPVIIDGTTVKTRKSGDIFDVALNDISDIDVPSPSADDVLKHNGIEWIAGSVGSASIGPGIVFYLDDTDVLPAGAGPQTLPIETLSKTPSGGAEDDEQVTVNNNTVMLDQYQYDTALGITSINAGEWVFKTHTYVDDTSGISEIIIALCRIIAGTGTITITGAGTSRTATVSGGTPFIAGDYNADITQTGHVVTPNGIFEIIGYTSTSVVTVKTLSTYTNESSVAYSSGRYLFQSTTGDIDVTGVSLIEHVSIQTAIAINSTDKLLAHYYAKTDNVGDIAVHLVHNGSANYSRFHSPLVTLHNDLPGLNDGDFKHFSAANYTDLTDAGDSTLHYHATDRALANATGSLPDSKLDNPMIEPSADVTANGFRIDLTNGNASAVGFGDVCYMALDGDLEFADADSDTTMPGFYMALGAINAGASGTWLMLGIVRDDSWNWTIGAGVLGLIYVSTTGTTGNTLTQTAPSATGDQIQIVGYAINADTMMFNPNAMLVEIT